MLKDIIVYHSGHFSFDCSCSFCINKAALIDALNKLGYTVGILPFNCDWDYFYPAKIHFDYALMYQNKLFGQFMFEADKMPKKVVEFANTYLDYVICGSDFLSDVWVNSGVSKNYLINTCLGVDTTIFNTKPPTKLHYPDKFKFLVVGNWQHSPLWEDRKGMDIVVKLFTRLFANNPKVNLIIKTDNYAPSFSNMPNVVVIKDKLTDVAMADLYKSCAINGTYLSLHKGEGFGRTALEALCCGCNIGATNFSGVKTFLNSNNATLFNYKLADWHIYPSEFYDNNALPKFAQVDEGQAMTWMKSVVNKKSKQATINTSEFNWVHIVNELMKKVKNKI